MGIYKEVIRDSYNQTINYILSKTKAVLLTPVGTSPRILKTLLTKGAAGHALQDVFDLQKIVLVAPNDVSKVKAYTQSIPLDVILVPQQMRWDGYTEMCELAEGICDAIVENHSDSHIIVNVSGGTTVHAVAMSYLAMVLLPKTGLRYSIVAANAKKNKGVVVEEKVIPIHLP